MMDEEIDQEIKSELQKYIGSYIFWRMREIAGEYADKIRVSVFFPRGDHKTYSIEVESKWTPETLKDAEVYYQEYEKREILANAKKFMEGKDGN